jgi:hypothetical protein
MQKMRLFLALLPLPWALFAQTGPAGHWEGSLQLPGRGLEITLDLEKDQKGAWIGTFTNLAQHAPPVPLADFKVDGANVRFRLSIGGASAPAFSCTLESETVMNCDLNGFGSSASGPLKRTGEAKIEKPKSSAAVGKEFEGAWEGTVEAPTGPVRVIVHLKNQPDHTVKATMDSPDQNAMDLPVSDIVQKGSTLEFQLRIAGGSFRGTLNQEGTQLAGDWTQNGATMPMKLKKTGAQ